MCPSLLERHGGYTANAHAWVKIMVLVILESGGMRFLKHSLSSGGLGSTLAGCYCQALDSNWTTEHMGLTFHKASGVGC